MVNTSLKEHNLKNLLNLNIDKPCIAYIISTGQVLIFASFCFLCNHIVMLHCYLFQVKIFIEIYCYYGFKKSSKYLVDIVRLSLALMEKTSFKCSFCHSCPSYDLTRLRGD